MCQMSIILEQNGKQEKVLENASTLEVTSDGIVISALFEEPKVLPGTKVQKIDFLDGLVTLVYDK